MIRQNAKSGESSNITQIAKLILIDQHAYYLKHEIDIVPNVEPTKDFVCNSIFEDSGKFLGYHFKIRWVYSTILETRIDNVPRPNHTFERQVHVWLRTDGGAEFPLPLSNKSPIPPANSKVKLGFGYDNEGEASLYEIFPLGYQQWLITPNLMIPNYVKFLRIPELLLIVSGFALIVFLWIRALKAGYNPIVLNITSLNMVFFYTAIAHLAWSVLLPQFRYVKVRDELREFMKIDVHPDGFSETSRG